MSTLNGSTPEQATSPDGAGDPKKSPPYGRMAAAALIAVVGFEGVGRMAERRLPPEPVWGSKLVESHAATLAAGPVDVLVVGSSSAGTALPASRIAASVGLDNGYTLWIPGATTEHVEMATFALGFKPAPCLLVVGTTIREFNGNGSAADTGRDFRKVREYEKVRGNAIERADAVLRDVSAVARLRRWSSKPDELVDNWRNPVPDKVMFGIDRDGRFLNQLDGTLGTEPPGHLAQERKELSSYQLDPRHLRTLSKIVRSAEKRGTRVAVVDVPTSPKFIALAPRGQTDYEEYLAAVRKVATDEGVVFIEPTATQSFTDEDFSDVNHLNERGTKVLLNAITPELQKAVAGLDGAACGRRSA